MSCRDAAFLAAAGLALLGSSGCRQGGLPASIQAPVRIGVAQELTPPSPLTGGGLGSTMAELVFRPLLRQSAEGAVEGDLAERWQWGSDGRQLHLHLRPNQHFSDGSPVTAADVVDTYRRAKPAEIWGFEDLADVEVGGPLEVLVRPSRPFLMPGALLVGVAKAGSSPSLGNGPYVVAPSAPDAQFLTVVANPHFDGTPPPIPVIEFHPFHNASDQWSHLLAQHVDAITFVPWNKFSLLKQIPSVRPVISLSKVVTEIRLRDLPPPFDQPTARRAIALAIDRNEIVGTAFRGQASPAVGPVWPQSAEFNHDLEPYAHSPDEARRLLKQLGCTEDAEGRLQFEGAPLRLDIRYWPGNQSIDTVALIVERQLAEAGIESHFLGLEAAEFGRLLDGKEPAALLVQRHAASDVLTDKEYQALPPPPAPPVLSSPEAVTAALHEAQRRLREEAPSIYLVWLNRLDVIDRRFCGLPALPEGPESRLDQVHPCAEGEDR